MTGSEEMRRPRGIGVYVTGPQSLLDQAIAALLSRMPGFNVGVDLSNPAPELVLLVCPERPDAVSLVAELRRAHPSVGVVCLVAGCTPADAVAILQAGAIGCVSGHVTPEQLAAALRQAARGEVTLSADLAQQVIAQLAGAEEPRSGRVAHLTPREQEILKLVCEGLANKEIGQRIFLSVRTVENHLLSIYTKLGVRTRTEAAVVALNLKADHKNP
jgi:DNA-binding NarL/FixJ family response regulator